MSSLSFGGIRIPYQAANIRLEKFDEFITERGIVALWEHAIICPCLDLSGLPASRCRNCFGRGYTYVQRTTIPVVFTNLEAFPQFMEPGLWVFGSAYVTTRSDVALGLRDRLVFQAYEGVYVETFRLETNPYTLPTREVRRVECLAYEDPATGNLVVMREGEDYTREGNTFTFSPSLPQDVLLSIRYLGPLVYVVVNILHEVRGLRDLRGVEYTLPRQYLVQREDFVVAGKKASITGM